MCVVFSLLVFKYIYIQMAVWYLTWGVLAYVMTLGKSNKQARDWVFTGQIVMLAAELAIVTTPGGGVLPSWLFPKMAEYEVNEYRIVVVILQAILRCIITPGDTCLSSSRVLYHTLVDIYISVRTHGDVDRTLRYHSLTLLRGGNPPTSAYSYLYRFRAGR